MLVPLRSALSKYMVPINLLQALVPRLRMRKIQPSHARPRPHRKRLRTHPDVLLHLQQVPQRPFLRVIRKRRIGRRPPGESETGESETDEITTTGNAALLRRSGEWARPRTNDRPQRFRNWSGSPNFLWSLVLPSNRMRLSVKKAAPHCPL
jgi:hypothetical protein